MTTQKIYEEPTKETQVHTHWAIATHNKWPIYVNLFKTLFTKRGSKKKRETKRERAFDPFSDLAFYRHISAFNSLSMAYLRRNIGIIAENRSTV